MNTSRPPLVSVVTPFYNTAPYLAECIESVLRQSHRHFEYLLVNNCSTDGSHEITARYAAADSRIRLVDNEVFLGQIPNYNKALGHISADAHYCKIVQADDWIFPRCLEEMVAHAEAHPRVAMVSSYMLIESNVYLQGLHPSETVLSGRDICRRFILDSLFVFGSPTANLLRADIVRARQPFYDENSPADDVDLWFEILPNYDFGFVHQVLTFTRRSNESLMSVFRNFDLMQLTEVIVGEKYALLYLSEAEWRQRRRVMHRDYYQTLAERFLRRAPRQYWDFHAKALAFVGLQISRARLAWSVAAYAMNAALNPKASVEKLVRAWRRPS